MRNQTNKAWRLLLLTAAPLLSSCGPSAEPTSRPIAPSAVYSSQPSASQPLGAHWIQDQRLRLVMAQLSSRNLGLPAGLPQDPESTRQGTTEQFEEVAALAATLEDAADRLPEVAGGLKMIEADHRGFLAEAQTLRDQAARLQDAAQHRRIEQMQIQMDLINSTCTRPPKS